MRLWDLDKNVDRLHKEYLDAKDTNVLAIIETTIDLYAKVFGTNKTIASFIYELVKSNGEYKGTAIMSPFFEDLLRAINLDTKFAVSNYLLITGEIPSRPIRVNFPSNTRFTTIGDEVTNLIRVLGLEDTILILKVIINNIGK